MWIGLYEREWLMRFTLTVVVVLALGGVFGDARVLSSDVAQPESSTASLEGIWMLNADLSDEPRARLEGVGDDRGQGRGRGAAGRRGSRPGGRGRAGGRPPDREELARLRQGLQEAVRDLMTAPRRMTIVMIENEIVATYDDGRVIRLVSDDQPHKGIAGTSMQVTRRTRWENEKLVTDISLDSRIEVRLEQTYEVRLTDPEGKQLIVTSRFVGGRASNGDRRELRRVYDVEPS